MLMVRFLQISRIGFEGWDWVLIASVPGLLLYSNHFMKIIMKLNELFLVALKFYCDIYLVAVTN